MKTYGFSIQGKSHIVRNTVCQDSSLAVRLKCGLYMGIVADGVGSARHADIGSKMAVEQLYRYCDSNIRKTQSEEEIKVILKKGYQEAMLQIENYVAKAQGKLEEYDTTLSSVIYDGDTVVYGHAGDGGIITRYRNGVTKPVTRRQKGVDGISVRPLRAGSSSWEFGIVQEPVASVLLVTDGMLDSVIQPFLLNLPSSKEEAMRGNLKKDNVYITATEFFMNPDVLYLNRSVKDPDQSMQDFLQGNESAGEEKKLIDRMHAGYLKLFGKNATDRLCNEIQKTCYLLSAIKKVDDDKSVVCLMNEKKKVAPKNASMYQEPDWKGLYDKYMNWMRGGTGDPPTPPLPSTNREKKPGENDKVGRNTSKPPVKINPPMSSIKVSPQMKEKLRRYRMNMRIMLGIIVVLAAVLGVQTVRLRRANTNLEESQQQAAVKSTSTPLPTPVAETEMDIEEKAENVIWLLQRLKPAKLSEEKAEALRQLFKENQLDVLFLGQINNRSPEMTQQPDGQEKETGTETAIQTGVITDRVYPTTEPVSGTAIQIMAGNVPGSMLLEILEEVKKAEKENKLKDNLEQKYMELQETNKGRSIRKKISKNVTELLGADHTGD